MEFGKLTTISPCRVFGGKYPGWLCKCECGNFAEIRTSNFTSGHVKSCGCLRHTCNAYTDPKEASWNKFKSIYEQGAKKRSLSWELDVKLFRLLTISNCYFCGSLPYKIFTAYEIKSGKRFHGVSGPRLEQSKIVVNGIDRLDNNIGYTTENSVPCCSICNFAKRDLDLTIFESWLDTITEFRIKKRVGIDFPPSFLERKIA
jgi:hypothetical protein